MASHAEKYGPYEIITRLGSGGMAETFLAIRRGPGDFEQRVCLKRVLPAFEKDEAFTKLFMREAKIAASLRHSNIVGVIDFGESDGTHFMALELIEGLDLRSLLRSTPTAQLPPHFVTLIAIDLAQALRYAHGKRHERTGTGIVHRDVSPSNVLISEAGEIKLTDFGIAKAMTSSAATVSGSIKGKIPYISPEQARGEPLDGKSDLFSLGVVLYEITAGARPFDGPTEVATLNRILSGEHVALSSTSSRAPKALHEIIERLIEVDESKRFQNASDLLDALANVPLPPLTARIELGALCKEIRAAPGPKKDPIDQSATSSSIRRTRHAHTPATQAMRPGNTAPLEPSAGSTAIRRLAPSEITRTRLQRNPSETPQTPIDPPPASEKPAGDPTGTKNPRLWIAPLVGAIVLAGVAYLASSKPGPSNANELKRIAASLHTSNARTSMQGQGNPSPTAAKQPPLPAAVALHQSKAQSITATPVSDEAKRAQPDPKSPNKATLVVTPIPWGHVWVIPGAKGWDSARYLGRTGTHRRIQAHLAPGRYRVAVGFDPEKPTRTTPVRLRRGQTRKLVIELPINP